MKHGDIMLCSSKFATGVAILRNITWETSSFRCWLTMTGCWYQWYPAFRVCCLQCLTTNPDSDGAIIDPIAVLTVPQFCLKWQPPSCASSSQPFTRLIIREKQRYLEGFSTSSRYGHCTASWNIIPRQTQPCPTQSIAWLLRAWRHNEPRHQREWHWVKFRADSMFAPSQRETALLRNDVSHWLGASLESIL